MRSLLDAVLLVFAATGFAAAQDLSSFHATAEKLAAAFNNGQRSAAFCRQIHHNLAKVRG
jgi:hypothetical protein